ncbi:MAG: NAD(P)/FAD-dependent oxidoreductase [Dehalococcoidia bacterium]
MRQESYEAVIIGSGMGGLCAGALLAHNGYKTLVLEKLPVLGGRLSHRDYKGYKLPTGAIGIETNGVVEAIFKEVEAPFDTRNVPELYYRVGGEDFLMPKGGGMRALIAHAADSPEESERVMGAIKRGLVWKEPPKSISFREWLSQYTTNPKIQGVFQGVISAMLGLNSHELPASEFIGFIKGMSGYRGYGYAPQGNLSLMESLAGVIKGRGGDVRTRTRVTKIQVEDEVVRGVVAETAMGEEIQISAKTVISNTGPQITVRMVGEENMERGYVKDLKEKIRPVPVVWLCIGSDRPLHPYPGILLMAQARRLNLVACPTNTCPELAPPGKHLLVTGGAPADCSRPVNMKEEVDLNIQDLRDNFPDFDAHAEVLLASCFHRDWPVYHAWAGSDLDQKTPVENLYNVGDGVKPRGWAGLPACAESARLAVEDIKARIKPEGAAA